MHAVVTLSAFGSTSLLAGASQLIGLWRPLITGPARIASEKALHGEVRDPLILSPHVEDRAVIHRPSDCVLPRTQLAGPLEAAVAAGCASLFVLIAPFYAEPVLKARLGKRLYASACTLDVPTTGELYVRPECGGVSRPVLSPATRATFADSAARRPHHADGDCTLLCAGPRHGTDACRSVHSGQCRENLPECGLCCTLLQPST